jgi:hypothetical protein
MKKLELDVSSVCLMYTEQMLSASKIASLLKVSKPTILRCLRDNNIKLRPKCTTIDISKNDYGNWTVLYQVPVPETRKNPKGKRGAFWKCRCVCGTEKDISSDMLRSIKTESCGCKFNEKVYKGIGELSGTMFCRIRREALNRNIIFDISIQDISDLYEKQQGRCALSNVPISLYKESKNRSLCTASLDRIDSDCGYTIDNVQWVHSDINFMKQTYKQSYFIELCNLVSKHNNIPECNPDELKYKQKYH